MMPKTDPFSVRLTPELYDRLMAVITTYDPAAHKSVTQKKAV